VSPFISELQQGFNGRCSPKDLETLFQLLYAYHTDPRKDADAFSSWKEKQKGILQNRNSDPQSVFMDTVRYVMSGYNPRFKPFTVESLNQISLERAFELYNSCYRNGSSEAYFFIGNF